MKTLEASHAMKLTEDGMIEAQFDCPAVPAAWDIFESRIYGTPGDTRHRILWVDMYLHADGTTPDLDDLLNAAQKPGGIDGGARTISIRPMFYGHNVELTGSPASSASPSRTAG